MSSLYKAQENLMQIIFGTESGAQAAADSYFESIPREMVFMYRDVVRYGLSTKIDRTFPKTKEYFVHLNGRKQWKTLQAQFIDQFPPQNLSYLNLFENFPLYVTGPEWLKELASYEAAQAIVRSSEIQQDNPPFLNSSLKLMKYRYNIPLWYKKWLDKESELRRIREVENGNESIDLKSGEYENAKGLKLPPPPSSRSDSLDSFFHVLVMKNTDEELRMFGVSRLGYDLLVLLKQGYDLPKAFFQLLPSAGVAVDEFSMTIEKYISEFRRRGVLHPEENLTKISIQF